MAAPPSSLSIRRSRAPGLRAALSRMALGAALAAWPLGASAQVFEVESSWGAGLGLEAFAGNIDFHPELLLDRQNLAGALGGLKLGRDVSFLGYYWRSTSDSFDRFEDLESWGGEVQLDIAFKSPIKPFLLVGGGRLHFRDDFGQGDSVNIGLPLREDQNVLIAGGGVVWDINRWLRVTGTARDYLIESPVLPEPANGQDSRLVSSWMFAGGIQIRIGGQPERRQVGGAVPAAIAAGGGGNTAVVPVPESGEIRVTYGAAGAAAAAAEAGVVVTEDGDTILVGGSAASVAAVNRIMDIELGYLDAVFPESTTLEGGRAPVSGERADTLERRLAVRFNEVFDYLMAVEADAVRLQLNQRLEAEGVGDAARDRVLARADTVLDARLALIAEHSALVDAQQDEARVRYEASKARRRFAAALGGANFSGGGQFLLGGRVGLNTTWQADRWAWVPEVALGFGSGGVTALVQGGLHYHVPSTRSWEVYGGLSAGLLVLSQEIDGRDGARFVVTPAVGVSGETSAMAESTGGAWGWFAEFQGVAFFGLNRLVAGLKWAY